MPNETTHRIGDGLPSTLTASRIKDVLHLAKSHERALTEALDANASPEWAQTASYGDLYERLRALLATIEGRSAYQQGRADFERGKTKLSGRADFLGRLLKSCWMQAPGQSEAGEDIGSALQDLARRLGESGAWTHLAEVVWASSVVSQDVEQFLDAIDQYPEIRVYLKDVRTGILPVEDQEHIVVPEHDGEVIELTGRVRQGAQNIDVGHLDEQELRQLSSDALRLADIARARDTQIHDIALQKAHVEDWETQHLDAIAETTMATDALASLKTRIEHGSIDQEGIDTVLDLADRLLSVNTRYRQTHQRLDQASREEDFISVASLASQLESLRTERDEVGAAINSSLAHPPSDGPAPQKPPTDESADHSDFQEAEPQLQLDQTPQLDSQSSQAVPAPVADPPKRTAEEDTTIGSEDESKQPTEKEICDTAQSDDEEDLSVQRIEYAMATALEQGRLGLAYHLALATPETFLSAATLKLLACNYVTEDRSAISAELSHVAGILLNEMEPPSREGTNQPHRRDSIILTTCAALAPAMVAPGGPVAQLLSRLEPNLGDMSSLRALARTAAEVSIKGIHIPTALLRGDDSLDKWRDTVSILRTETKAWLTNERQSKIKFHAATRVWRRILEEWERGERVSLGQMFIVVGRPEEEIDTDRITLISEYWRAHGEREIDRIDREFRSRASNNKIEGPARLALRSKIDQALAFSDRWLSLIRERPDQRPTFHTEQAELLRNAINANADRALAEVGAVDTPIARVAKEQLARYRALFKSKASAEVGGRVGLGELLNADLLADPNISFDDTGQPTSHSFDSDALLNLVDQDKLDFAHAAVERARRGDVLNAETTIDFAERTGRINDDEADQSRTLIDQQRAQIQRQLEDRIKQVRARLDAAYAEGALALETYDEQSGRIPNIDFSETKTYSRFFVTLDEIGSEIDGAKEGRRDAMRRSLGTLVRLSSGDAKRIESAIDAGLFQIAEDFVERIERGEELPAPDALSDRPFDLFFPHYVEHYSAFGSEGENGLAYARRIIENRLAGEFFDATNLSEDASRDGVRILEAWGALYSGQVSLSSLRSLVAALGFQNVDVKGRSEKTMGGGKNMPASDDTHCGPRHLPAS